MPESVDNSEQDPKKLARFEECLAMVSTRYPIFESMIKRALRTPQKGPYHNEGPTMESHVIAILLTLDKVLRNEFPDEIDIATRALLYEVISADQEMFADYAFLHDMAKPDRMTLKRDGKEPQQVRLQTWEAMSEDERAQVTEISYFHDHDDEHNAPIADAVSGHHGPAALDLYMKYGEISEKLIRITEHHMVAHTSFDTISAQRFIRLFGEMPPGMQRAVLSATYLDSSGSLRADSKPDLLSFINITHSYFNLQAINEAVNKIGNARNIDEKIKQKLLKADHLITPKDLRLLDKRNVSYDAVLLRSLLEATPEIVSAGKIDEIVETAVTNPRDLGAKFGKLMEFVKPALAKSLIIQ